MIVALDYSLSCPALCIASSPEWKDAKCWYLTDTQKYEDVFFKGQIKGSLHREWKTPEQRYHNISEYFIKIVSQVAPNVATVIEDYSMGSTGRVFNIAENCGIIKHKLFLRDHKLTLVPPTVLKKFATGSGAADKIKMYEAFKTLTGVDLSPDLGKPGNSPMSDIIDAYFLARYGLTIKEE